MKRLQFFITLCLIASINIFADETCDISINEGKKHMAKGNYSKAKELFDFVIGECGAEYGNAGKLSKQCDEQIKTKRNASSGSTSTNTPSSSSSNTGTKQSSSNTSSSAPSVIIKSVTYEDATVNGAKGLRIHVQFSARNMKNKDGWCIAWFANENKNYLKYNGTSSYANTNGYIWAYKAFKPTTANQLYKDYTLFIPYDELRYTGTAQFFVEIKAKDGDKNLTTSSWYSFESTPTPANLSVSKNAISSSSYGSTEYITVTCDQPWEIQYASGDMYTATKTGDNTVKVEIKPNLGDSRSDFFNIKASNGSKSIRINLSQYAKSTSSSSSSSSSSYRSSSYRSTRSYKGYEALHDYNLMNGDWEVDWMTIEMGIGTGYELEWSFFNVRWSFLKIEPVQMGIGIDFISDSFYFYYQPEFKFVFPWDDEFAVEIGVGPSIKAEISGKRGSYAWFVTEAAIRHHWGTTCSTTYFMRYDGTFNIGASFNISSGY